MPNLAGVLDLRKEPADIPSLLRRFGRVLSVDGLDYHERSWHDERFGAVNLLSGVFDNLDQPAVSADGNRVLFLDGSIDNRDDLRALLGADGRGAAPESAAGLCLALLERHGESFAELLSGQFNLVVYDRRERSVTVCNDRLGYRPFYFLESGGLFLFALEQKAILAGCESAPAIDPFAVLEFFTFGHHLEDRTLFGGVRALPQAAVLRAGPGGLRLRQYWKPSYHGPRVRLSLPECAEELGRRFLKTVARQAAGGRRKAIFLSGGLDSRAVAAGLARVGAHATAFTLGDDELWHAREVARRLGFRHRRLVYRDTCYRDALPRVVWRTECTVPFHSSTSVEQHKNLRGEGELLFNGHFGDVLFGDHMLPEHFLMRRREQLFDNLLAKRTYLHHDQLRGIFRPDFLAANYPAMLAELRKTVDEIDEDRVPLMMNIWTFTVRQRRYTFASPAADRYLLEPVTPFFDKDLIDWGLSMPLRFLVAKRVYTRMVHDLFPEVASVPIWDTGRPVAAGSLFDLFQRGSDVMWKRLRRRLAKKAPKRGSNTSTDLADPRLRDRIEEYLDSDAFLSEALDAGLIRDLLDRHFDRGERQVYAVAMLLTLAEGTRLFVERPLDGPPEEVMPDLGQAAVA